MRIANSGDYIFVARDSEMLPSFAFVLHVNEPIAMGEKTEMRFCRFRIPKNTLYERKFICSHIVYARHNQIHTNTYEDAIRIWLWLWMTGISRKIARVIIVNRVGVPT